MKRIHLGFFTVCAVLGAQLVTSVALATGDEFYTGKTYESPRNYHFEFKIGPYAPNVDDNTHLNGKTPFTDTFGKKASDLMYKWEVDRHLWQGFGTFALGAEMGYYNISAAAVTEGGDKSASKTSLRLIPISALAVYRFDWPALRFNIPLVPYAKAGLTYVLWNMSIDDHTEAVNEVEGSGGTLGWQFNAGIAFLLDVLEPTAAKTLDTDVGVNHTYAFVEFAHIDGKDLTGANKLNVGDTTWNAGIAFEF